MARGAAEPELQEILRLFSEFERSFSTVAGHHKLTEALELCADALAGNPSAESETVIRNLVARWMEKVTNAFWDSFDDRGKGTREPMVLHLRNLALFEEPEFRVDPSSIEMIPFMELAALLKKPSATWSTADWDTFMYWHTKNQEWLAAYRGKKKGA